MKILHTIHKRTMAAFSLVETLVATGVIATALTGSLGMMAVGLGQSRESIERARAAMLAQQVHADFRAGSPTELPDAADARFSKSMLPLNSPDFAGVALIFDESFKLVAEQAGGGDAFSNGAADVGAAYIVTISGEEDVGRVLSRSTESLDRAAALAVEHKPLGDLAYDFEGVSPATTTGSSTVPLSRDIITVEAPAAAPANARKRYRYEFLRQF